MSVVDPERRRCETVVLFAHPGRLLGMLVIAGALLCCVPAASPAAGLLREVRVTVVNDSGQPAFIKVDEMGVSGIVERWHNRHALIGIPARQTFVASSGEYDQRTLAIADSPSSRCENGAEGLVFANPLLGYPEVGEARQETSTSALGTHTSWRIRGSFPHTRSFGEGNTFAFWDKAVRVTRGPDSHQYIEFTETILRQQQCR